MGRPAFHSSPELYAADTIDKQFFASPQLRVPSVCGNLRLVADVIRRVAAASRRDADFGGAFCLRLEAAVAADVREYALHAKREHSVAVLEPPDDEFFDAHTQVARVNRQPSFVNSLLRGENWRRGRDSNPALADNRKPSFSVLYVVD